MKNRRNRKLNKKFVQSQQKYQIERHFWVKNSKKYEKFEANKPDLRASGLSLLPLALRPGLLLVGERNSIKNNIFKNNVLRNDILNSKISKSFILLLIVFVASFIIQNSYTNIVSAASLTLTIPNSISLDINPNSNNGFKKSDTSILSVKTDVSYGYTLSIKTKNDTNSNNLANGSAKLSSIGSAMSESDFSNSAVANTWGYLPSKLAGSVNTNFQPGPASEPTILDITDSSTEGTDYDFTLAAKVDNTIPTGNYTNTFVLTAVANEPPIPALQNWDGCSELSDGQTIELQDIRDKKKYSVAKLKDGKCWMTKNLELENYNLTSADSDVESEFELPPSSTDGFNNFTFNVSYVYVDSTYGGYYSWFATTAGEGTDSQSTGDTAHSICPKGWKLPTDTEYRTLISNQGIANLTNIPANFLLGGQRSGSSVTDQNSHGYYWSSTAGNSIEAYYLDVRNDFASAGNRYYGDKGFGHSVRCVAREPEKKSYSITYDQGLDRCDDPIKISEVTLPSPNPQTGSTASSSVNLSPLTPTYVSKYTFVQWCTVKPTSFDSCSGQTYLPGAPYPLSGTTNNVTLWAIWKYSFGGEAPEPCVTDATV